jgi:DNA polymerase III psi subunit
MLQAELAAQIKTYLLWCEERGLSMPSPRRHPERSEGSLKNSEEILRSAQDDGRIEVVFVADELNAEDDLLLSKMATAMGLTATDYIVMNVGPELESMPAAKAVVTLGDVAADAVRTATVATIHPRDLRRQPALKRQAWQDLQTVMAKIAPKANA